MGGTHVSAPQPSPEERNLQAEQLKILQQQQTQQNALLPFELQQMGLTTDAKGGYRRMTEAETMASMTPQQQAAYQLQNQIMNRESQALQGNLPIDPGLETQLNQQQSAMTQELSNRLGANWQTSTAGQQGMANFLQMRNAAEEQARQGMMGTAQGMLGNMAGITQGTAQQQYAGMQGLGNPQMGLFSAYGNAMQPYQYYSGLQNQANMQNATNQAGLISSGMGMLGTIGGFGLGGYLGNLYGKKTG